MRFRDGCELRYQHGHQRRPWNAKAAAAATKKPVCKHRSLLTPPLPGACAARHCQRPVIQGQLPHTQHASGCSNIMLASSPAGSPCILYPSLPLAWVSHCPLISGAEVKNQQANPTPLTPSCLGEEQMPEGDLQAEAGPNPKRNPRNCANKEKKGKFLPAASGAAD